MIFYEIHPESIPDFRFAYSVELGKFRHSFKCVKDFLELCIVEKGIIKQHHADGRVITVKPGELSAVVYTDNHTSCSVGEGINRHTTVGVGMKYTFKRYESELDCDFTLLKERMKKDYIILIPYHEDISEIYDKAINIIKSIGICIASDNTADRLSAVSKYFALMSLFTDFVLKKIDAITPLFAPSENRYVTKAVNYINQNYAGKITVENIAEFLEISEGYLQHIFRRVKGMTVTEYINICRVYNAIDLMRLHNISLKDAASNVGVSDPAYMSRLFKKVTGLSCREYFGNKYKE